MLARSHHHSNYQLRKAFTTLAVAEQDILPSVE